MNSSSSCIVNHSGVAPPSSEEETFSSAVTLSPLQANSDFAEYGPPGTHDRNNKEEEVFDETFAGNCTLLQDLDEDEDDIDRMSTRALGRMQWSLGSPSSPYPSSVASTSSPPIRSSASIAQGSGSPLTRPATSSMGRTFHVSSLSPRSVPCLSSLSAISPSGLYDEQQPTPDDDQADIERQAKEQDIGSRQETRDDGRYRRQEEITAADKNVHCDLDYLASAAMCCSSSGETAASIGHLLGTPDFAQGVQIGSIGDLPPRLDLTACSDDVQRTEIGQEQQHRVGCVESNLKRQKNGGKKENEREEERVQKKAAEEEADEEQQKTPKRNCKKRKNKMASNDDCTTMHRQVVQRRQVQRAVSVADSVRLDAGMRVDIHKVLFTERRTEAVRSIRVLRVIDAMGSPTLAYVHAGDLGGIVERKSNISRLFGGLTSPTQKMQMKCVGAHNHSVGQQSNVLTGAGVASFLTWKRTFLFPRFATWVRETILPMLVDVKSPLWETTSSSSAEKKPAGCSSKMARKKQKLRD